MNEGISVHTLKGSDIWQTAVDSLINSLNNRLKTRKKVLLLLSGGSVVKLYERITSYELRVTNLAIGQIDERKFNIQHLTFNKEEINAEVIRKTGIWEICDRKNIPYYLISQEGSLEEAANNYNQQLSDLFETFSYKIGVFGIGEDAHIAGLIPGYEAEWNVDKLMVGYDVGKHRQNNPAVLFCPQKFRQRITVAPKAISQLDYAIVVVTGEKKRKAIEQALDPININNLNIYPAAIIQKMKRVDLFTDIKEAL